MDQSQVSLDGKVAIVTGGSRGIGRSIALGLASAGADVVVASRKLPDLEKVRDEIKELGRGSIAVSAHTGKMADLNDLVDKTLEEFGKVDILINNAGTNPVFGPALDIEEPVWDKVFDVNLKGAFFLSQTVCRRAMKETGGSIVNIASTAGLRPSPGLGIYSISKAALIMLTQVQASEWGPFGIRVNAIAPGVIKTRFSRALWDNPQAQERGFGGVPLGRLGQPEDIVGSALFLASDASAYVTGEVIVIDGGSTLRAGL